MTLRQTSPLRRTRLRVIDEAASGLSYYDYTFLIVTLLGNADGALHGTGGLREIAPVEVFRRYDVKLSLFHGWRYRAGDRHETVVTGIHLTINGIAAGLRNSG